MHPERSPRSATFLSSAVIALRLPHACSCIPYLHSSLATYITCMVQILAARRVIGRFLGGDPALRAAAAGHLHAYLAHHLCRGCDLGKPAPGPHRSAVAAALLRLCHGTAAASSRGASDRSEPGGGSAVSGAVSEVDSSVAGEAAMATGDGPGAAAGDGSGAAAEAVAAPAAVAPGAQSPELQRRLPLLRGAPEASPSGSAVDSNSRMPHRNDAAETRAAEGPPVVCGSEQGPRGIPGRQAAVRAGNADASIGEGEVDASQQHGPPAKDAQPCKHRGWAAFIVPGGRKVAAEAVCTEVQSPGSTPGVASVAEYRAVGHASGDGGAAAATADASLCVAVHDSFAEVPEEVTQLISAAMRGAPARTAALVRACTVLCKCEVRRCRCRLPFCGAWVIAMLELDAFQLRLLRVPGVLLQQQ